MHGTSVGPTWSCKIEVVSYRRINMLAPILKAQFELVGPARPQEEWPQDSTLFQEAPHQFTSYCTVLYAAHRSECVSCRVSLGVYFAVLIAWQGRKGCQGMLLDLSLERRQDLFYFIGRGWLPPSADVLTLTIVLPPDSLEPIVCAVVPSKQQKNVRLATEDLKQHTGVVAFKGLPSSLTVLSEGAEVSFSLVWYNAPGHACAPAGRQRRVTT
jgi:hypothetical protein